MILLLLLYGYTMIFVTLFHCLVFTVIACYFCIALVLIRALRCWTDWLFAFFYMHRSLARARALACILTRQITIARSSHRNAKTKYASDEISHLSARRMANGTAHIRKLKEKRFKNDIQCSRFSSNHNFSCIQNKYESRQCNCLICIRQRERSI